jgi:tRNA modification GTPase
LDYFSNDTIAAIATSLAGDGGVGILRLSGPQAVAVAQACTTGLEKPEARYCHRIRVLNKGEEIDDGLGVWFPKGHSFTGEDVIELQIHGGRFVLQEALRALLSTGLCRMAAPGEFSFRAVRNGKMSLTQAEAVAQLVKAKSPFELWSARQQMGGARDRELKTLVDVLRDSLAKVELSIDFADQDVEVIAAAELKQRLANATTSLQRLMAAMALSSRIAAGPLVALVGRPNAGKSTLFNALLSEERAIVSPSAGTTRDVLTEEIVLGPYRLRLADTAGLRQTAEAIEKEGIRRAQATAEDAEVVILLVDGSDTQAIQGLDFEELPKAPDLVVINKADVAPRAAVEALSAAIAQRWEAPVVALSAAKDQGVDAFIARLRQVLDGRFGLGLNCPLPTERQMEICARALRALEDVVAQVAAQGVDAPELVAVGLRDVLSALAAVSGETTPDLILAKIFSEFCIGK